MNKQTGNGFLELEVTDFGPVVEARVDLRPLTVFVGPSNTGKSYLAILLYALHRVFSGDPHYTGVGLRRMGLPFRLRDPGLSETSAIALLEVANSLHRATEMRDQGTIVLPPSAADALRSGFDGSADVVSSEIARCFGVGDSRALIRKGTTSSSRVVIRWRVSGQGNLAEHTMTLARKSEFRTSVPAEVPIPVDFKARNWMEPFFRHLLFNLDEENGDKFQMNFAFKEFLSSVCDLVLPSLVGPLHLPAYYLPADRTGVMHAHSVVVSALIAKAPTAGLRPAARTPTLSGVLADFLEQLIGIAGTERTRRKVERDLGSNIEETLLGGSVRIDRSTHVDCPSFAYRPYGWKDDLALANASSMVSELAPVVLYLRHMIEPGNILIIEEPESHLHPAMQVKFAGQIAALVEAGIRVIVTTHSEWLLEELANIVRRSELPRSERGGRPALRPNQVGAWLFEPKQRLKGSVITEIRLDDSGLYPAGYDEVARALHNEWADISSRVEAT